MDKLKYRIRRLFVENVKRIKVVEVIPKTDVVEISGQNAQGKSSVLDSIIYVLGGKEEIPIKPIRDGEETAKIVLETDDFTATRTFTDKGTYLKVAANTGKSPQAYLDSKINKISFDPVEFSRKDDKEKEELLRKITGLDTKALETEKARMYELRKVVGREVERLKVFKNELGEPVYGLPDEEASSSELLRKIDDINSTSVRRNQLVSKVSGYKNDITLLEERLVEKDRQIKELKQQYDNLVKSRGALLNTISDLESEANKIVVEDTTALRGELMSLEETNKLIRKNQQIATITNQHDDKAAEYNDYTQQIHDIDTSIQELVHSTEFPIEGLSVDESGIIFNGQPISQASQAEQIKIGLAIAESLNPELQIVLVKDGSLLDKTSMRVIRDFAKEKDCQIWVERIEPDSQDAIIIEDGGVVSA